MMHNQSLKKRSLENRFVDTDVVKFESSEIDEMSPSDHDSIKDDSVSATGTVELVTEDEDIDDKFSDAKTIASDIENEEEDKNPNIVLTITLRSFDILFYIVEKTITVRIKLCPFSNSIEVYLFTYKCFLITLLIVNMSKLKFLILGWNPRYTFFIGTNF